MPRTSSRVIFVALAWLALPSLACVASRAEDIAPASSHPADASRPKGKTPPPTGATSQADRSVSASRTDSTLWEFDAHGCLFSAPAVVGNEVCIGSCAGNFYSLDRDSGQPRWTYDIDQDGVQSSFHGNSLVSGDLILTSTDAAQAPALGVGHVYAFERATGAARWKYRVRLGFASDIVGQAARVYVLTLDYRLLCLDLATGRLLWQFDPGRGTEANSWNAVVAADDHVIFGGADSVLYAVQAVSGALAWKRDLGRRITTGIAVLGRSLYFGTADSMVHRLGQASGALEAELRVSEMLAQRPAVRGDSLIIFGGYQSLTCLGPKLERVRWRQDLPGVSTTTGPVIWNDEVLTGTEKGDLLAYRASDGAARWSGTVAGIVHGIGTGDGSLYISTLKGTVLAYRPASAPR